MAVETAGIYIHIPFCKKKCPYCGFFSTTDLEKKEKLLFFLKKEMELLSTIDIPIVDTIYIGGGTPSIYESSNISEILDSLYKNFKISEAPEITIEINPESTTSLKLSGYRQAGINRISIGVQSFCDKELAFLGRIHTAKQAKETIRCTRDAGIENISIDLIYALSGQTHESWVYNLKTAVNFSPEHISCYMLTCEPKTPLNLWRKKGFFKPLNDKIQSELFQITIAFLKSAGYFHYEISNFASDGYESEHNKKYWLMNDYIGIGAASHSMINLKYGRIRRSKCRNVINYIKHPLLFDNCIKLSKEECLLEDVVFGLRLMRGLYLPEIERKYGKLPVEIYNKLMQLVDKKMLEFKNGNIYLSEKGELLLDCVMEYLWC